MKLPIRVAAAGLAAVALAPAAAHAQSQQQYTLTVGWQPAAPTTTDDVALKATTTAPEVYWDFDGDGHPDDSGAQVVHRFAAAGDYRVIVKATWPGVVPITKQDVESIHVLDGQAVPTPTPAATASPQPTVAPVPTAIATPAPPDSCSPIVFAGKFSAHSWCFKKSAIPGGSRYTSTFPISINGIGVGPTGGKPVTIDVTDHIAVDADNAHVYFRTKNTTVQAYTGKVAWKVVNDHLSGFTLGNATLGGMRVTGMPEAPLLERGNASHLGIYLALPAKLGGGTSTSPVAIDLGGAGASSLHAFSFNVPLGSLPGLQLHNLTVSYDGDGLWDIAGGVSLPSPTPLNINGDIGVRNGLFDHLQASADYGTGGPSLGPITLRRISFRVELLPKDGVCVPKSGTPVLALCGDVSLTAGPKLLGAAAIGIDGHLGFAVYGDRPAVFHAMGSVKLVGMPLANADLEVHSNGYIYAHGDFYVGWKGIASLKGFATLEMKAPKFNAEANVSACLEFVKFCAGAHALVSSKGIAACLNIDTFLGDWHPGFADKWGYAPKLYFSGCDVGPYRDAIAASAAAVSGNRPVRLGKGLPGATIVVTGAGGPPQVAFVGPHGERIEAPAGLEPAGGKGWFVMKSPGENLTQIALAKPSAGTWRVEALPGSPAITRVESADGLAKPGIHATVHGHTLRYTIKPQPGQVVKFSEHGASAGGAIGTAHGAHGTLAFTPAAGRAETREIIAIFEQDGALREKLVVARYSAPAATRPAAVKGLEARRSGTTVRAGWHGRGVLVTGALSDGRRPVVRPRGQGVTVPHVARGTRATITVRALSADDVPGRRAVATA